MITKKISYNHLPKEAQIDRKIASMFGRRYTGFKDFKQDKNSAEKNLVLMGVQSNIAEFVNSGHNLLLLGNLGTGKTTDASILMQSALAYEKEIPAKNGYSQPVAEYIDAHYISVLDFFLEVKACWQSNKTETETMLMNRYKSYDLLIFDEIGEGHGTANEVLHICDVIRKRDADMKSTILISNFTTVEDLERYIGAKALDRVLGNGTVIVYDWESYRKQNKFSIIRGGAK